MPRRKKGPAGLLLFPGAGTDANHPSLRAVEDALAPFPVRRADFPYRKEGRKAPDRPPKLIAAVVAEAEAFAADLGVPVGDLALGGRSMGGRMCSMAVAEGLATRGLVLVCYPLHPPGKPESLRTDHFPDLRVPCLFVSGTRDPFGSPDEFDAHLPAIPGPVTTHWIEGKRHDLRRADAEIGSAIGAFLPTL